MDISQMTMNTREAAYPKASAVKRQQDAGVIHQHATQGSRICLVAAAVLR